MHVAVRGWLRNAQGGAGQEAEDQEKTVSTVVLLIHSITLRLCVVCACVLVLSINNPHLPICTVLSFYNSQNIRVGVLCAHISHHTRTPTRLMLHGAFIP